MPADGGIFNEGGRARRMDAGAILEAVASGAMDPAEAQRALALHSIDVIGGYARVDEGRISRRGVPEVVFAEGKQLAETREIVRRTLGRSGMVLVSRIPAGHHAEVVECGRQAGAEADEGRSSSSSVLFYTEPPDSSPLGTVGILCAGTSDIGVAEEARLMCRAMGCSAVCSYDVGVAGMHRLFPAVREMISAGAGAIVAVAGMEGALATVVTSVVDVPVIGVPTSVGYGHGGGGEGALSSMLQSCALGMSVVNIDNGIGGGAAAAGICRRAAGRGAASSGAGAGPGAGAGGARP